VKFHCFLLAETKALKTSGKFVNMNYIHKHSKFQINYVLHFLFIKESWKTVSCFFHKNVTKCSFFRWIWFHVLRSTTFLILEQHSNQPIRFEWKFTVYVKFRLTTRVRCFYINVIHLSFSSDFRDQLWVGIGLNFQIRVPGSTTCLTWQNHSACCF